MQRLRWSVTLAVALHGVLVATARYRLSYDAYTHMFFADHYGTSWWSLWEPRWYGGFSVASYPPLVHQLIGALSFVVGVEIAWAIVLLGVLVALPSAVYAFARVFVGRRAAEYAALLAAVSPAISLTAHMFGQLPTLAGLLAALWALAALGSYLRQGRRGDGAFAVALVAVVGASHHGTLLFLPWGVAAVALQLFLAKQVRARMLVPRLLIFGVAATVAAVLVVWPFWQWIASQTLQAPIDHPSRHNFLRDPQVLLFMWPIYGPLLLVIPWALRMILWRKRMALAALFAVLLILALGGTTPLPRWLYGRSWEWLTYDRFALWSSVVLLPCAGLVATVGERRLRLQVWKRRIVSTVVLSMMGATALVAALLPTLLPTQPPALDLQPVAAFLNAKEHRQWRYLTFGFGDQMARLSLLTDATTIDGSYHTARSLPELHSSGIGQIDAAYWAVCGLEALDPILERASTHGVRWGFVNRTDYEPVLVRHGWVYRTTLANGVAVWENPMAVPPTTADVATNADSYATASWGVLPLGALSCALVLARARRMVPTPHPMQRTRLLFVMLPMLVLLVLATYTHTLDAEARRAAANANISQTPPHAGESLPPNTIAETVLADGGGYIVSMAFAPDGRLFFTTKGGFRGDAVAHVRIVEAGKLRDQPFLSTLVATDGERGLLGIALDPDFATNHYVYVYQTMPAHTTGTGYIANRVVRYTEDPATQTAIPGSATVLLDVPSNAQNQPSTIHNGGNLHFGPDGKLYITIGDGGRIPANAQNRGNLMGKIHRLNPDGSVPGDNPFVGDPATVPSIWSYGHRNSFDFAFDPLSHQLFFTENGPACDDKVHRGVAGGNYGWPNECGTVPPGAIAPLYRYPVPIGITGIEFYGGPIEAWHNTLFWCAINTKRLYHARLNDARSEIASVKVVDRAPLCAGDVLSGPEGALYFSEGATIFRIRLSRSSAPSSPVNSVRNSACRSSK